MTPFPFLPPFIPSQPASLPPSLPRSPPGVFLPSRRGGKYLCLTKDTAKSYVCERRREEEEEQREAEAVVMRRLGTTDLKLPIV